MVEIVLWRHGQTDYNRTARIQGRVDPPLNDTGVAQARRAAPAIASLGPTRIVSSPLRRALGTAQILADFLADSVGLPVETEADVTERSFGDWEGLTREQIRACWPEQYRGWKDGQEVSGVGVETRDHVARRVGDALARLSASAEDSDVVVVVSHGSATHLGACALLGMDPSGWFGLGSLGNCCYARLSSQRRAPGWAVHGWNLGCATTQERSQG